MKYFTSYVQNNRGNPLNYPDCSKIFHIDILRVVTCQITNLNKNF